MSTFQSKRNTFRARQVPDRGATKCANGRHEGALKNAMAQRPWENVFRWRDERRRRRTRVSFSYRFPFKNKRKPSSRHVVCMPFHSKMNESAPPASERRSCEAPPRVEPGARHGSHQRIGRDRSDLQEGFVFKRTVLEHQYFQRILVSPVAGLRQLQLLSARVAPGDRARPASNRKRASIHFKMKTDLKLSS